MTNAQDVYKAVRERYGSIARSSGSSQATSCCGPSTASSECCSSNLYDASQIANLSVDVTGLSLGCGDPVTLASLKPGETVLDLGSGGGIDCFMAARAVGPTGAVIGVDMTPEMLEKARANAAKVSFETSNVEFRQGQIENLPVEDSSVDVIMSNCVINLSPDKASVFREAFRVLKPGGRISISDIVTVGDVFAMLPANLDSWAACVSGAIDVNQYVGLMREAGFADVEVVDKVNAGEVLGLPMGTPRILSARITARKPEAS